MRPAHGPVPGAVPVSGRRVPGSPMRQGPVSALGSAFSFLFILSGCYNYAPLTTPDPHPGTRIAAELTDSGMASLARYLGPDVRSVDGQFVSLTAQDLSISVLSVRHNNGVEDFWKGEPVTLPRGDIGTVRERKLAVARSAFLVTVGVGAGVALLRAFGVVGTGSSSGGQPPPPQ